MRIKTKADIRYEELVKEGWSKKEAAKKAQDETGISVVSGLRMKTRSGW